jgi:ribosomal protein L11 methyltransferase
MPWLQAHLTVTKDQAPLIELLFENLGAVSVLLGDAADEPMLEPGPGETPLWSHTRVTGLFEGDTDADALRSAIAQALQAYLGARLELEVLEDREWERAWLDNFQPMRFGERLWVCPHGLAVDAEDAVVVRLDPGLAFGTGTHPTTALCLAWLDSADLTGKTLIDYGCGSGILAVAALKLGARQVIGVDHDPQALLATRDNAQANGVADRLTVLASDAPDPAPADIVLGNILANVLIELAPRLAPLVAGSGELVLSGILEEQWPAVAAAYADGLDFDQPTIKDGWVRLHARRTN